MLILFFFYFLICGMDLIYMVFDLLFDQFGFVFQQGGDEFVCVFVFFNQFYQVMFIGCFQEVGFEVDCVVVFDYGYLVLEFQEVMDQFFVGVVFL